MAYRKQMLERSVATVLSGQNLDVVGVRGSGRSLFLSNLADLMGDEGWRVVWVSGNVSLRNVPFGALQAASIVTTLPSGGRSALVNAIDSIIDAAGDEDAAIFVDDWDDLDESSWGAIEAVRQRTGRPVVLSRLQGRTARHTPTGLQASTSASSYEVTMAPLTYRQLRDVLEARLGAGVEVSTLSRIYAKSGGIAGVATAMVNAGVRDGRLVLRGGTWIGVKNLWSSTLNGLVEASLEPLDSEERDALMMIALAGVCDIQTIRQIIDWSILESLEEQAMVRIYSSGTRQLVTVHPPLLVEYLRSGPLSARKIRLTDALLSKLGNDPAASLPREIVAAHSSSEEDAIFARLIQEQARTRSMVAHAEWMRHPSPGTAVECARSMMAFGSPEAEVEAVLLTPVHDGSDLAAAADLLCLRAEWFAFARDDLDEALRLLADVPASWGPYVRVPEAFSVTLESYLRSIPKDYAARLEITEGLPPQVVISLQRAQMHLLITLGRFAGAREAFDDIDVLSRSQPGYMPDALNGLAMLSEGRGPAALAWSRRGYEEAHSALDFDSLRGHASVYAYCLETEGRYSEAEAVLATVFPLGRPPQTLVATATQLMFEVTGGLIAARRGNAARAAMFERSIIAMRVPDGPLPHQSSALIEAQLLSNDDKAHEAAELLWTRGLGMIDRGILFPGVLTLLASIEAEPNAKRLAEVTELATGIEGTLVSTNIAYLQFVAAGNGEGAEDIARRLVDSGQAGLAVAALDQAIRWAREDAKQNEPVALLALRDSLTQGNVGQNFETARFNASQAKLTEREAEVARLIAHDLTNQQIADMLVLSVRTVETHTHRIMRKTGARSRHEINERMQSLDSHLDD